MRKVFARTKNVESFVSAMTRITNRQEGIPGMALVYGEPGLGKTRTALWWVVQSDGGAIFVRTKKLMTGRWLLEEIVAELGEAPETMVSALFRQCVRLLLEKPRVVVVDEVDYLAYDARVIETLRDIYDVTDCPIIFIGMGEADKKLMRFKHLWDRFGEVLKFSELTVEDVRNLVDQLCEIEMTDGACRLIHQRANRFRRIMYWLYKSESIARTNSLKEITEEHLRNVKL